MDQELEKYLFTAGIDGRWATAAWIEIDMLNYLLCVRPRRGTRLTHHSRC